MEVVAAASPAYPRIPGYLKGEVEVHEGEKGCFESRAPEVVVNEEGSSESSSIGEASESSLVAKEAEEEEEEAESKVKEPLGSLDSLEDALPIKRGLSNFFNGKSKSFACLSAVASASAEDLVKPENPFNKRRRILMAAKNSRNRRSSYASLLCSNFTAEEGEVYNSASIALPPKNETKTENRFKSPRSFSLSDLRHA